MINHSQPPADFLVTDKDPAWVEQAIADRGAERVVAGGWLYAVRKWPWFGQPIIMRCRAEVAVR